jgi:hypothetical protein
MTARAVTMILAVALLGPTLTVAAPATARTVDGPT